MNTSDKQSPRHELTGTECLVLGMLTWGERSAYDINKSVQRGVSGFWTTARAQVYTILPKFVERGLATMRPVEQSDRPDKQLYTITRAGEQALRDGLRQGIPSTLKDATLLKVAYGNFLPHDELVEVVQARRDEASQRILELEELAQTLEGQEGEFYSLLAVDLGVERNHAVVRWAETTLRKLGRRYSETEAGARSHGRAPSAKRTA
jgi:PadR family transcriptional regulator, regulatory protein AphA